MIPNHVEQLRKLFAVLLGVVLLTLTSTHGFASDADIDRDVDAALTRLYAHTPAAKKLGETATAMLVFPNIVKAGFLIGAEYGVGALREQGRTKGYYSTTGVSYGLQAGIQNFGYALFFMDTAALKYLDDSGGWELGTGPTLVVVDQGVAKTLSSTTLKEGIYAFTFDQSGVMGGIGLKGTRISPLKQ